MRLNNMIRSGNILVMTMIVVVMVASMLALSTDRLFALRKLEKYGLVTQQATYASEATASMVEANLISPAKKDKHVTMASSKLAWRRSTIHRF